MDTVFIVGVEGAAGRRLGRILAERGHRVLGLHRKLEQDDALRSHGVERVSGDLVPLRAHELGDLANCCDIMCFHPVQAGRVSK